MPAYSRKVTGLLSHAGYCETLLVFASLIALSGCGARSGPGPTRSTLDLDADRLVGEEDRCPNNAEDEDGFEDDDGCPDPDNDQDGILDIDDFCPDEAEDQDQFEDEDGCPDPDNDEDRIVDRDDECPDQAEIYNGTEDDDGCPDAARPGDCVEVDVIHIAERFFFLPGSAATNAEAAPLFDALAQALRSSSSIERVGVSGGAARDEANADLLSRARAEAVRRELIDRGISPARLETHGFGVRGPRGESPEMDRVVWFAILRFDGRDVVDHPDGDPRLPYRPDCEAELEALEQRGIMPSCACVALRRRVETR